MANFGFEHLGVVAPYAPHWREARSAVGAPQLLRSANESASLAEAVKECTLVIGTGTLTHRKPEQSVIPLPSLTPLVELELARGGHIALVFGPEKHGLTRNDLSYCHALVEIPTDPRQPSMNLGQAAAVCLYEVGARNTDPDAGSTHTKHPTLSSIPQPVQTDDESPAPTSGNLDRLAGLIEKVMAESDYSPRVMQAANRHSIRILLRRLNLNSADSRRILGLFRRVLWRLGHPSIRNVTN